MKPFISEWIHRVRAWGSSALVVTMLPWVLTAGTPSENTLLDSAKAVLALNPSWEIYQCEGSSMEPFLYSGDLIILSKTSLQDLDTGMLIAFYDHHGDLVLHQLIGVEKAGFRAKGVNNHIEDHLIQENELIGHVVAVFPQRNRQVAFIDGVPRVACRRP